MGKKELNKKEYQQLFKAIVSLENEKEASEFMRDLCTLAELKAMAERWQVAQKVNAEIPYRKINAQTGVSTATITRVAHWLHHGMGGYKLMLERFQK